MKLKQIFINNFRGIKELNLQLNNLTTILIGENNTGKTTILEAIRKVLDRNRTSKKGVFVEHDYFSEDTNGGLDNQILIELWFKEDQEEEWTEEITQVELEEVAQLDLNTNLYSIGIRLKSIYDRDEKISNPSWSWLGNDGSELQEINSNHTTFFKIVQFFYLDALRDAKSSFSSRSIFWREFLKLDLTPNQEIEFTQQLQTLNNTILSSDIKVDELKSKLDEVSSVVSNDIGNVSIQAFPEKPWDLSNKATLMITTTGSQVELPLERFGQGTQSLSVLMLFKAYAEILMQRKHEQAFSILGLEEPEVHLYPQAVRSLWNFLQEELPQQKIISTHSTFFIQEADLRSLKLLKRVGTTVKVYSVQQIFEIELPNNQKIREFSDENLDFSYQPIGTNIRLKLNNFLSDSDFNSLNQIYDGNQTALQAIADLKIQSAIYLSDDEILDLKYYTERIRGEIFFAKAWLLCEGQSEYLVLRYFAQVMGKNLDKYSVSVIDYKNNGSAALFIQLAKHFDMPWLLISDSDQAYNHTIREIKNKRISEEEIDNFVRKYSPTNIDIEIFLYDNGFKNDYLSILTETITFTPTISSRSFGQTNDRKDVRLIYKSDETSEVRILVSDNIEVIIHNTNTQFRQLYDQILRKKQKTEEDIQTSKLSTDFSGQSEKEILKAKVANINYELWKNQDGTYKINISVHGEIYAIDSNHNDYDSLLRHCTIKLIKKQKILNTQKLIRKLQDAQTTENRVPQFFKNCINQILGLV